MFKKLLFLLVLISTNFVFAQPSNELLFSLNQSVLKVHVATKEGHHGVGSGVVIQKDYVVTNCHVIANAQGVHVTKFGYSYSPDALIADWKNDLCILKFKFLELPAVKLGSSDPLEYEMEVFGKSYGGNTVKPHTSYGKIKGIHPFLGNNIIQSSAWFSLGASGGGLFNSEGELIGVTTFKTAGRFAYFYSVPVEVIKTMLSSGEEISVTTQRELPFWDAPEEELPYFMKVVRLERNKDWENLKKVALDWEVKEPESIEAINYYGIALFHLGEIELAEKQFKQVIQLNEKHSQSIYYLYKIAKTNNQLDVAESYKTSLNNLDDSILANEK